MRSPLDWLADRAARFALSRWDAHAPRRRRVGRRAGMRVPGDIYSAIGVQLPFTLEDEAQRGESAYTLVSSVHRAADIRARSLAKLSLNIFAGEGLDARLIEREPGNVRDVWESANNRETSFNIVEQLQWSLDLIGNAYLFLEMTVGGVVTGLFTLPAHLTRPVLTPDGVDVDYYRLVWGAKVWKIPPDQVVHIPEFKSGLARMGISPLAAVSLAYKTHRLAHQWNYELLRRGGEWSGAITSPPGSADLSLDPTKRRRLEVALKKRFSGPRGQRRPVALPPGAKIERTMMTPKELQLIELIKHSRETVYEVYGIPDYIVSMQEHSSGLGTGGGVHPKERIFWEYTMEPVALRLSHALTELFFRRFDERLHCAFDLSGVHALRIAKLEMMKAAKEALGQPLYTPNEIRVVTGFPETDDPADNEIPKPAPAFGAEPAGPGASEPPDVPGDQPPKEEPPAAEASAPSAAAQRARRSRQAAGMARAERLVLREWKRLLDHQEARTTANLRAKGAGSATLAELLPVRAFAAGEHAAALACFARHAAELRCFARADAVSVHAARRYASEQRTIDIESIFAEAPEDRVLVESMLRDIVSEAGQEALSELVARLDYKINSARAARHIASQTNRALTETTATTRELLRASLAEGVVAGESMDGLIARVREVFDDRRDTAITIARTESASAFNFAQWDAWGQTDGLVTGKRWVAILDDHTRDAHADADGQEVGIDDAFDVDGEALMFPGDPAASAGNVINCRCTLDPVLAAEDERARGVEGMLGFLNRAMRAAGVNVPARAAPSTNGHRRASSLPATGHER